MPCNENISNVSSTGILEISSNDLEGGGSVGQMADSWCPEKRRCPITTLAGGVGFDPAETLAFDSPTVAKTGFWVEMHDFSMNFQLSFLKKFKFDQD